jgi:hypothetical protein
MQQRPDVSRQIDRPAVVVIGPTVAVLLTEGCDQPTSASAR